MFTPLFWGLFGSIWGLFRRYLYFNIFIYSCQYICTFLIIYINIYVVIYF